MGLVCLMMNGPFTSHRFMLLLLPNPAWHGTPSCQSVCVSLCPRLGSLTELT